MSGYIIYHISYTIRPPRLDTWPIIIYPTLLNTYHPKADNTQLYHDLDTPASAEGSLLVLLLSFDFSFFDAFRLFGGDG